MGHVVKYLLRSVVVLVIVGVSALLFARWRWNAGLRMNLDLVRDVRMSSYGGTTLAFTPDDAFVATNTHGRSAQITFTALPPQAADVEFAAPGDQVSSMTIDSTGTWLAARCRTVTICIWTMADAQLLGTIALPPNESVMSSLQFINHHAQLQIVWGSQVEHWSLPQLKLMQRSNLTDYHAPKRGSMVISAQGTYVAMGNQDGQVTLWAGGTGASLMTLRAHGDEVAGLAFSPDERLLATASFDRMIHIWQLPEGRLLHTMKSIGNSVLAFNPDGTILASGDGQEAGSHGLRGNSYVFLWDTATGARIGRAELLHPDHDGFILDLAFSATGQLLGCADSEGIIHVWRLVPH
jgi:WD40 repeat protein